MFTTNNINTQASYSSSINCAVNSVASTCSIASTNLLKITIPSNLINTTSHIFTINSLILSRSYDQPGNILFKSYEKDSSIEYLMSSYTFTPPINTQTNAVTSLSLSIANNPSLLSQNQKFTLTILSTNKYQSGDIIKITIPP